jgi:aquaporin Z
VNRKILRPLVAEFVGTALFVFLGAASVVMNAASAGAIGAVGIAAAHGLALSILITATMRISGGHLNPAVSVGLWVGGKIGARDAGTYVAAQVAGAVVAGLLVKLLLPAMAVTVTSAGAPELGGNVTFWQAVSLEALLTFFLVSAVFGTAVSSEAPAVGGFAIGLTLFVAALVAGPLTGAALNPARAIGPALIAGELHGQAVYWIGPLAGGIAAAFLWKLILLPRDPAQL